VEETMGSLYTFPRRLFWSRLQPKLSTLSQHFFFDLVRELTDTPRTHATKEESDAFFSMRSVSYQREVGVSSLRSFFNLAFIHLRTSCNVILSPKNPDLTLRSSPVVNVPF
jgi:hypothetical protein